MAFLLDGIKLASRRHRWETKDEEQPSLLWNFHLRLPPYLTPGRDVPSNRGNVYRAIRAASAAVGCPVWEGWKCWHNLVTLGFIQPVRIPGRKRPIGYRKVVWLHTPRLEKLPRRGSLPRDL